MERFLVDQMLLRLGRWLRLMGLDVANPQVVDDSAILGQALAEERTLITRDRRLAEACMGRDVGCILIRSSRVREQILEMAERGVSLQLNPCRCTLCNSPLIQIQASERQIWMCEGCGKLYWEGSHWKRIKKAIEGLQSSRGST
ncbi:MAG: Mut7-C RNAse domain-containing protein [Methanothrix sp.]|nr:Mut7-C RNAse domain-containing protein [Methanothrix sp.]